MPDAGGGAAEGGRPEEDACGNLADDERHSDGARQLPEKAGAREERCQREEEDEDVVIGQAVPRRRFERLRRRWRVLLEHTPKATVSRGAPEAQTP